MEIFLTHLHTKFYEIQVMSALHLILPTLEKSEILHAIMYLLLLKLSLWQEPDLFHWLGWEEFF